MLMHFEGALRMLSKVAPATLLDWKIAQMGSLAEQQLAWAINALSRRDPDLADIATANATTIKNLSLELQEELTLIIANRRPNAGDLRQIMSLLKIAGDLERIGDLGKNIVRRALAAMGQDHLMPLIGRMRFMAEMVQTQLNDVLVGLAQRDVQKALAVWRKDEDVDAMHNSIFRELFTYMMEDPLNIGSLLLGAKNIERIGDHATNIAEQIYFAVCGAPIGTDRPKRDNTSSILVFPEPNVPKTQLLSQAHESKDSHSR
jgi:phosphate transport system protein